MKGVRGNTDVLVSCSVSLAICAARGEATSACASLFPSVPLTPREQDPGMWSCGSVRPEPTGSHSTRAGLRLRKGTAQNKDRLACGHTLVL